MNDDGRQGGGNGSCLSPRHPPLLPSHTLRDTCTRAWPVTPAPGKASLPLTPPFRVSQHACASRKMSLVCSGKSPGSTPQKCKCSESEYPAGNPESSTRGTDGVSVTKTDRRERVAHEEQGQRPDPGTRASQPVAPEAGQARRSG